MENRKINAQRRLFADQSVASWPIQCQGRPLQVGVCEMVVRVAIKLMLNMLQTIGASVVPY